MREKFERFVIASSLGLIPPLAGFLGFWWGSYFLVGEQGMSLAILTGLLFGILVDIVYLKRWIQKAHQPDLKLWGAIYLFYSICFFGFFMGVPVFNLALAIPAGIVIAGRLKSGNFERLQMLMMARRIAWFTTGVLALLCIASAFIALADPFTAANLQGMLALPFEVTHAMVVGLIVVGGIFLLISEWWLTIFTMRFSFSFFRQKA